MSEIPVVNLQFFDPLPDGTWPDKSTIDRIKRPRPAAIATAEAALIHADVIPYDCGICQVDLDIAHSKGSE